jgi:TolA-binding protein
MSVKRITIVLVALIVISGFTYVGLKDAVKTRDFKSFQKVELNSKQSEIKELNIKYEKLNSDLDKAAQEKGANQDEVERLKHEKDQLEKQKRDLEVQLQSRIEEKSRIAKAAEAAQKAINTATLTQTAHAASGINCSNPATAKAFIYCKESGNVSNKWNGSGCYGLGQDCNGIVYGRCGADYTCQDIFFTDYMQRRYGTWENAKAHWLARVPIGGRDVGNWW